MSNLNHVCNDDVSIMKYIDLHSHMSSRTTDDYEQMAMTGCTVLSEPAFWSGYDHESVDVFTDYFERLTRFEPRRAAGYGIRHFTWLAMNPKESDNRDITKRVLEMIPKYLERDNVLGIGEMGLNRVTQNEVEGFRDHVELAVQHDLLMQVHTPHLEDKFKGTKLMLDMLSGDGRVHPGRVLIDHIEEHTIGRALQLGFWVGISLYPQTKVSLERAVDMIEMYGPERICVASACDWGPSLPVAVPKFVLEMRRRGHKEDLIEQVVFDNPKQFLEQSPKCRV